MIRGGIPLAPLIVIGALIALIPVAVFTIALVLLSSTTVVVIVSAVRASFGSRLAQATRSAQPVE